MDDGIKITEVALEGLVSLFYARVREDASLGPVFNDEIENWPEHLEKLVAFWSSVMLTTGRYKGNPVLAHLAHKARITPELFQRWLTLWNRTTAEVMAPDAAAALQAKAARIAESLQLALFFKLDSQPNPAARQPDMAEPYRSTPVFNETTLPAALRARHTTKAGVWGVVRVLEGKVKLTYLEPPSELLLDPDTPGPLLPDQPHFVEPLGAMKMRVDFYNELPSEYPRHQFLSDTARRRCCGPGL